MKIKFIMLSALAVACGPIAFAQRDNAEATTKRLRGIRSVNFRNFIYRITLGDPVGAQTIRLRNGKHEEGGKYEAGGLLYELYGKPAYEDVNGDGIEDAVVEIKLSGASRLITVDSLFNRLLSGRGSNPLPVVTRPPLRSGYCADSSRFQEVAR